LARSARQLERERKRRERKKKERRKKKKKKERSFELLAESGQRKPGWAADLP